MLHDSTRINRPPVIFDHLRLLSLLSLATSSGDGSVGVRPPPPIAEMAAPLSFGDSRKKKEDERFVGGKGGQNETHTVQRGGLKKV